MRWRRGRTDSWEAVYRCRHIPSSSSPRMRGSSTPRLLGSIIDVSGILGRPVKPGDDGVDMCSHSRDALRPSFARNFLALEDRGRREDRVRAAPAVPCADCTKKCCTRAYRAAENTRPSLRNGFTAYAVLSPETSSWLTPSLPFPLALPRQLDAGNGRQDHTVSPYAKSTPSSDVNPRPPLPAPRCDDGQRPSEWDGMGWI